MFLFHLQIFEVVIRLLLFAHQSNFIVESTLLELKVENALFQIKWVVNVNVAHGFDVLALSVKLGFEKTHPLFFSADTVMVGVDRIVQGLRLGVG